MNPLRVWKLVVADASRGGRGFSRYGPPVTGRPSEWVILDVVREEPLTGALHTNQEERRP